MGFPVGYTDLFLPKIFLFTLTILGLIRKLISALFRFLGLGDFLEPEISFSTRPDSPPQFRSVSAALIRELLPVVIFSELGVESPESCAVCLYEFDGGDEIRRLANCRHIFHRSCLDRWMDHDQKTCPLCRTPFIPEISFSTRPDSPPQFRSVSAALIRELLPVVFFSELGVESPEICAVCLYEFDGGDEIRRLANCRHIFHRSCLDRWMDHDQKTCPLCRTPFIPEDLQESFNERLWAASGIGDFYDDYSSPITGL